MNKKVYETNWNYNISDFIKNVLRDELNVFYFREMFFVKLQGNLYVNLSAFCSRKYELWDIMPEEATLLPKNYIYNIF